MIDLPATPKIVLAKVVVPALALLPVHMDTPEARVMLVAIALQESGLRTRQQVGGPAHGLWQNERPVQQLLIDNKASAADVCAVCKSRAVAPIASDMYWALLTDDVFAAAIARLILWCDPHPLPALGDADDAWVCYQKNWGPGKPRPVDWPGNYSTALAAVTGTAS